MNNQQKYFAGIGSRETPGDVADLMTRISSYLTRAGFWLRSGGAVGADLAFERGVQNGRKRIFRSQDINLTSKVALASVDWFHPAPHLLKESARLLMARNLYQITGIEVEDAGDPIRDAFGVTYSCPPECPDDLEVLADAGRFQVSKFVVCWTPDACCNGYKTTIKTGGTGQALRIAAKLNVPIYNLKDDGDLEQLILKWMPHFDEPDYKL